MASVYQRLKPILLVLGIAFMATWTACGGAGSSGAAPTGGGDTPVTVDIPAVNTASDLVYMTGPVVSIGSGSLSAKSTKSMDKDILKNISTGSAFTGNSYTACQTSNVTRELLKSASNADMELCFLAGYIIPALQAQGVEVYNRDVDAGLWVKTGQGTGKLLLRFNIQRNSSNAITDFKMYICSDTSQTQFTHETFSADGESVTILGKEVGSDYTATNNVTGDLSAGQYTSKHVEQSSYQESGGSIRTQSSTMDQLATSATVNGFSVNAGLTTQQIRIYSVFGFLYGGLLTDPLDLGLYYMTSGAGHLIDNGFVTASGDDLVNDVDGISCWDTDGNVASTEGCSSAITQEPVAVSTVSPATYSTGETIDCSVLVAEDLANTLAYTYGSESNPLEIENSTCSGFAELDSHMDCYDLVYGDFTVTVTIGGNTPSTISDRPSILGTTTPTIILTTNFPAYQSSFIAQLAILTAPTPYSGNVLSDRDFTSDKWSGNGTILTLHPTLVTGRVYTFTLGGDMSGLNGSSLSDQSAPQQATVFYMTP